MLMTMTMLIQCDICNFWVHIKCNNLYYIDYKYLQGNNDPWLGLLLLAQAQHFPLIA